MRNCTIIVFAILFFGEINAQEVCPCCTEPYRQFDFWLGQWSVYDTTGQLAGNNTIQKIEGNCIISESWKGVKGSSGRSYSYFDRRDSTWNQTWVDSGGGSLILKGQGGDGQIILKGPLKNGPKGKYYDQITWQLQEDSTVTQIWKIYDEGGNVNKTLFYGLYRKEK